MKEARRCFREAVELDSTFAMAYLHLADRLVAGTYPEKKHAIDRAVEFSGGASRRERLYIEAASSVFHGDGTEAIRRYEEIIDLYPDEKQAYVRLGELYRDVARDLERSRWAFEKAVAMDPLAKGVYNQLAYLYNFQGDFERSIWAINQYINLATDEPNPYDSRGDLYAYNGRIDEAVRSYEIAIENKDDFYISALKLGHMAMFRGDYDGAREYYERVAEVADEDNLRRARMFTAYLPLYEGRFGETLRSLEAEIERDRREGYAGNVYINKLFNRAFLYAELQDHERATAAADEYRREYVRLRPEGDEMWRLSYGFIYFTCGRSGEAEDMLGAFLASIDSLNEVKMMGYATLKGLIEMEAGNTAAARSYLERANRNVRVFSRQYWLGRAYLSAGLDEEALAVFDDMLNRYTEYRAAAPVMSVKAWYYAGLASEKTGDFAGARRRYERFLDHWRTADPVPQEVTAARSRLERISGDI
jgi:tetratricopeptide (TPR) repeat protein